MRYSLLILLLLFSMGMSAEGAETPKFDANAAARFADLALTCVHKEYPNKISHSMNSDADVGPPRKLTPAFYGCYDWHSSVHGHWLLARLVRTYPDAAFVPAARRALRESLTAENIAQEAVYLRAEGRRASSARMGWRGCCNWRRSCGSGTIRRRGRWRGICVRWRRQQWSG